MSEIKCDLLIIGGGLTGLSLAYFLRHRNLSVHIVEARNRLGGRILTERREHLSPMEAGATWLGSKHTALVELLYELDIQTFIQKMSDRAFYEPISTSPPQLVQLPPNDSPSFRISGGTDALITALLDQVKSRVRIHLSCPIQSIVQKDTDLLAQSNSEVFRAKAVVSTLPPNLLAETVTMTPELPRQLSNIMKSTHTWMGESIKIGLHFDHPFWREEGLSGTLVSNVGPIPELYDHSNVEDDKYALKGFLNSAYYSLSRAKRIELIIKQLERYYGEEVHHFTHYEEKVWALEKYTYQSYSRPILPHQNNGHSVYTNSLMNDKLIIAGSETSDLFPGYMEGAVRSARMVADRLNI